MIICGILTINSLEGHLVTTVAKSKPCLSGICISFLYIGSVT